MLPSMSSKSTPKKGSGLSLKSLAGYGSLKADTESAGVLMLLVGDAELLATWGFGDNLLLKVEVTVKQVVDRETYSGAPGSVVGHGLSLLRFLSSREGGILKVEDDIVFM